MRNLMLAAAALMLVTAPAYAASKKAETNTTAPKAERHYDCTKKGNANKAECKAEAVAKPATPAKPAAAATPAAKPAAPAKATPATPAAKAAPATAATGARTPSPAQKANQDKMKACGASWDKLSEGQKADWKAKGEKFKDKNGKPYTGWITYSIDCRKR